MDARMFTDALSIQLQLLRELLALLERETKDLSDINLEAIAEVNGLKTDVTSRIEKHTAPLREAIAGMALDEGLTANATLGEVASKLKIKGNRDIPRLHHDLNEEAEKIRRTLSLNHEIAQRFVSSVNNSLNLLSRVINQSNIYGASGGYQQRPAGAVMINREA